MSCKIIKEAEILGVVLPHEVEGSGTAVVTLILNVDGPVWYSVQEWMDGMLHCGSSVRYYHQKTEDCED